MRSTLLPRTALTDPSTGLPVLRKDGRPVYVIAGGEGETPPPAGEQPPATPPPAFTPQVIPPGATIAGQVTTPQPGAPAPGQAPSWYSDGPEAAQAYVDRVVREAASHRVAKNELQATTQAAIDKAKEDTATEWQQKLAKALGLVPDEAQQLTPEQYAEQLATRDRDFAAKEQVYTDRIRSLTIDNALTGALAGAQPGARDALIGSGKLKDLDPDADDFTDKLKTRVGEYLDAHPYFKTTPPIMQPPAGSSGGDFIGQAPPPPGGEPSIDELRKQRQERRGVRV